MSRLSRTSTYTRIMPLVLPTHSAKLFLPQVARAASLRSPAEEPRASRVVPFPFYLLFLSSRSHPVFLPSFINHPFIPSLPQLLTPLGRFGLYPNTSSALPHWRLIYFGYKSTTTVLIISTSIRLNPLCSLQSSVSHARHAPLLNSSTLWISRNFTLQQHLDADPTRLFRSKPLTRRRAHPSPISLEHH